MQRVQCECTIQAGGKGNAGVGLGSKIKRLREYKELNQEDLAKAIGALKSHISNIENDKGSISFEKLGLIVSKYNMDARYFFDQIDSPEEADLSRRGADIKISPMERLEKKLDRVSERIIPITKLDPLAEKVMNKPELRDLIEMIWQWEPEQLRRFSDIAFGWIAKGRETTHRDHGSSRRTGTGP